MLVGSEIIAFSTIEKDPTSTISGVFYGGYILKGLIRGMYNTEPIEHTGFTPSTSGIQGDEYGDLVSSLFNPYTIAYTDADINKIRYFYACTYYGQNIQTIEDTTQYACQIQGLCRMALPCYHLHVVGDREGIMEYSGASFTLGWEFINPNIGFNFAPYDFAQVPDPLDTDTDVDYWLWSVAREAGDIIPTQDTGGQVWGATELDSRIQRTVLRFYQTDGTLIGQRIQEGTANTATIDFVADLASNTVADIQVIPQAAFGSISGRSLRVTRI